LHPSEPSDIHGGNLSGRPLGSPIEDEATAKQKLDDAGFDPVDANKACKVARADGVMLKWTVTPMVHFAAAGASLAGDLPMCRYLHANGASVT